MKQCPRCQQYVDDYATFCSHCGYSFNGQTNGQQTPPPMNGGNYSSYPSDNAFDACGPEGKSRGVAALLAILLGGLGIQYFSLGKSTAGIISIVLSLVTCGIWSVIALIQGILMFCMTNEQFRQKYIVNPSSFPLF